MRANGAKLYVLGMGHSSHVLWSVDHVSFCARFLEMRKILNSRFLPNLWRRSDASVLGEAGGWALGWSSYAKLGSRLVPALGALVVGFALFQTDVT